MVGDAEQHLIAVATGLDQNHLAFGSGDRAGAQRLRGRHRLAVFDRILDEVRQRLADQFAVAVKARRHGLDAQGHAVVFRERLVEFLNAIGDVGRIEVVHIAARLSGFGARDHQQRIEGPDQAIGFLDGSFQRAAIFGLAAGSRQRLLGAIAQPRQRRLQIVGDVVGDFLQSDHQGFDALQHGVEIFRQTVELVAAAPDRQPPAQVARHDALRGAGHRIDPPQHAPRNKDTAAEAKHDHDQQRPLRRIRDNAKQPPPFVQIAPDQETEAAGQFGDAHQCAMIGGVLLVKPPVGGFGPARFRHHARCQRADIAGERLSRRRGHKVEIGARPQRAVLERENQSAQSAPPEDLADLAGFRVHRGSDLLGNQPARVPGEIAKQRRGEQRKQKQIYQRQPERRGSDQLTECRHGSCTPRRESYEAAAARSPCRSWSAAAKYARR